MQTASQIIDSLGGTVTVAAALGVAYTVVHSWRRANAIPGWRQASLLALAVEKQVSLSTTDFPAPDERVRRRAVA